MACAHARQYNFKYMQEGSDNTQTQLNNYMQNKTNQIQVPLILYQNGSAQW